MYYPSNCLCLIKQFSPPTPGGELSLLKLSQVRAATCRLWGMQTTVLLFQYFPPVFAPVLFVCNCGVLYVTKQMCPHMFCTNNKMCGWSETKNKKEKQTATLSILDIKCYMIGCFEREACALSKKPLAIWCDAWDQKWWIAPKIRIRCCGNRPGYSFVMTLWRLGTLVQQNLIGKYLRFSVTLTF